MPIDCDRLNNLYRNLIYYVNPWILLPAIAAAFLGFNFSFFYPFTDNCTFIIVIFSSITIFAGLSDINRTLNRATYQFYLPKDSFKNIYSQMLFAQFESAFIFLLTLFSVLFESYILERYSLLGMAWLSSINFFSITYSVGLFIDVFNAHNKTFKFIKELEYGFI